jgi:hypothetical protein
MMNNQAIANIGIGVITIEGIRDNTIMLCICRLSALYPVYGMFH